MKTPEETVRHLEEIITHIYLHPAMYGANVGEVEQALWIYHQIWCYVAERDQDYRAAEEAAGSGSMSFTFTYRKSHPAAGDHEVLRFVLKHWAMITERLGIPLPTTYPEPGYAFMPGVT